MSDDELKSDLALGDMRRKMSHAKEESEKWFASDHDAPLRNVQGLGRSYVHTFIRHVQPPIVRHIQRKKQCSVSDLVKMALFAPTLASWRHSFNFHVAFRVQQQSAAVA